MLTFDISVGCGTQFVWC